MLKLNITTVATLLFSAVALSSCSETGSGQINVDQSNSTHSQQGVEAIAANLSEASGSTSADKLAQIQLRNALYDDFAVRAQNAYSGIQIEVPQSLASSGVLLNTILIGMAPDATKAHHSNLVAEHWAFQPWKRLRQLPLLGYSPITIRDKLAQGQIDCQGSGFMVVSSNEVAEPLEVVNPAQKEKIAESHFHFDIEYNNCQDSGNQPIFNGRAEAYFSVTNLYFDDRNFFEGIVFAFDDLQVSYDNQTVSIIGATFVEDGNKCDANGAIEHSVLVRHHETGTQLLLDNVAMGWRSAGGNESDSSASDICWEKDGNPSYIEGRFLHSDYGLVTVSSPAQTAAELQYIGWRDHPDVDIQNQYGTAKFRVHQSDDPYNPYIRHWTTFSYQEAGSEMVELVRQQQLNFIKGGYSDLSDSDSDGMVNSWERMYDLNPEDATDAQIDLDRDTITNKIEHDTVGNPHRNDIRGISGDSRVTLKLFTSRWDSRVILDVTKDIPLTLFEYFNITDNSLVFEANMPGEWQEFPDGCSIDSANRLLCNVWLIKSNANRVYFSPSENGTLELKVTLDIPSLDYWPENNQDIQTIDYFKN